jgi:hypothetical protein
MEPLQKNDNVGKDTTTSTDEVKSTIYGILKPKTVWALNQYKESEEMTDDGIGSDKPIKMGSAWWMQKPLYKPTTTGKNEQQKLDIEEDQNGVFNGNIEDTGKI